jgi:lantibiotic modifying enzyme
MAATGQEAGQGSAWAPLAGGALADRIEAVVIELADALAVRAAQAGDAAAQAEQHAEHALLRAYLACASGDEAHADVALDSLDRAADALGAAAIRPTLYGGFTGIAWMIEHVQEILGVDGDGNAAVDAALIRMVDAGPWPFGHDIIAGLAGIGVYALARAQRPGGEALLGRVVARLDAMSENDASGAWFYTPPERLSGVVLAALPHGCRDLGVAHGAAGVAAVLARAHATGKVGERAGALARDAVRWLLDQRLAPDEDSCFPARRVPGRPAAPTRSAWCYGDPGVAVAVLGTAQRLDEPAWAEAALVGARKAAVRPDAAAGVVDAGICHGAAGLAHLFQRLFRATGEALFHDAAHAWLERTLALREPGAGIAGFRTWGRAPGAGDGAELSWYEDPGLLSGATGIALALLAAVSPVEPAWDRLFVADI